MQTTGLVWNPERMCWSVGETETHFIEILPMILNHRVVLTPKAHPETYDAGWCYARLEDALGAVQNWDPETQPEPAGYKKRAV